MFPANVLRALWAAVCSAFLVAAVAAPACQPGLRVALDTFGSFYFQSNGRSVGIDVDVFDALSQRLHCPVDIQNESVVRAVRRIELGEADASAHKFADAERARFAWLVPYVREVAVILVRKDVAGRGAAGLLADGQSLLGVGKSWQYGKPVYDDFAAQMRARGRTVVAADADEMFSWLQSGRIQMLITSSGVYQRYLRPEDLRRYRIEEWGLDTPDPVLNLMLSQKTVDDALLGRVVRALRDMRADGSLRRIVGRYVPPGDVERMLAP